MTSRFSGARCALARALAWQSGLAVFVAVACVPALAFDALTGWLSG